jgi:hypothetical protein
MKRTVLTLFVLLQIFFSGCGRNPEQTKRYSEMQSECDSLIAGANSILAYQKTKEENLTKTRDHFLASKSSESKITKIEKELIDVSEIVTDIETIKKHLENIKTFAKIGEKVNSQLIYYKRTYVNYSTTIQVHDENVMIQEITGSLSAKQYIAKYLPENVTPQSR